MTLLLSMLLISPVQAQDCDAASLESTLEEASPASVGKHFAALAACDPKIAKTHLDDALGKMIENEGAQAALLAALTMDGAEQARAFIAGLDPSESARTLGHLSAHCEEEGVTELFVTTRTDDPDAFFDGGWYRALSTCNTEDSLALLSDAVEDPELRERLVRTQWTSLVATYARAAGPSAIPSLTSLASSLDAESDLVDIVGTFADAARVGSTNGTDLNGATAAVKAIQSIGPKLPPLAVEKARTTLLALGDEKASDDAVVWRWPDRIERGAYSYALVAVEDVTCKNGKRRITIHTADVTGFAWPDQLEDLLLERVQQEWDLNAKTCKGTAELRSAFPNEPFGDATTRDGWTRKQAEALRGDIDSTVKVVTVPHDDLAL